MTETVSFTLEEIDLLRELRLQRYPMASIVHFLHRHSRDEIVEAIDATIRQGRNLDAMRHVNRVLAYQADGIPLVNGNEVRPRPRDLSTARG